MVLGPGHTTEAYQAWSSKSQVDIDNAPTLDGYAVKLAIPFRTGLMQTSFQDIRFATYEGIPLPYWIESFTASVSAVVWVRVPVGTTKIVLYHGAASVLTESNGRAVFEYFEDWLSPSAAVDTVRWAVTDPGTGTVAVSSGALTLTSGTLADNPVTVESIATFGTNYALRMRTQCDTLTKPVGWGFGSGGNPTLRFGCSNNIAGKYESESKTVDSEYTDLGKTRTGYHIWEVQRIDTSSQKFFYDNLLVDTDTTNVSSAEAPISFTSTGTSGIVKNDWLCIRKVQDVEPVCTLGDLEATNGRVSCIDYDRWSRFALIPLNYYTTNGDYQVKVGISFRAGEMQTLFQDIRFATGAGVACPYWIESSSASTSAVAWVRVPAYTTTIVMYFGNIVCASTSSGPDTFPFFDSCDALPDVATWDVIGTGGITNAAGITTIAGSVSEERGIVSKASFGQGYAMRCRMDPPLVVGTNYGFIDDAGSIYALDTGRASGNQYLETYDDGPVESVAHADNTGYDIREIRRIPENRYGYPAVYLYINDAYVVQNLVEVPTVNLKTRFYTTNVASTTLIDWVLVRRIQQDDLISYVYSTTYNNETTYEQWWPYAAVVTLSTPFEQENTAYIRIPYRVGETRTNFYDVRFSLDDGTPLPFTIADQFASNYADCWVKVPAGVEAFLCLYGNETCLWFPVNNGNDTWPFCDMWLSASLDTTTWTPVGSTAAVTAATQSVFGNVAVSATTTEAIKTVTDYTGWIFGGRIIVGSEATQIALIAGDKCGVGREPVTGNLKFLEQPFTWGPDLGAMALSPTIHHIEVQYSSGRVRFRKPLETMTWTEWEHTGEVAEAGCSLYAYNANVSAYYLYARPYQATEPVASLGMTIPNVPSTMSEALRELTYISSIVQTHEISLLGGRTLSAATNVTLAHIASSESSRVLDVGAEVLTSYLACVVAQHMLTASSQVMQYGTSNPNPLPSEFVLIRAFGPTIFRSNT